MRARCTISVHGSVGLFPDLGVAWSLRRTSEHSLFFGEDSWNVLMMRPASCHWHHKKSLDIVSLRSSRRLENRNRSLNSCAKGIAWTSPHTHLRTYRIAGPVFPSPLKPANSNPSAPPPLPPAKHYSPSPLLLRCPSLAPIKLPTSSPYHLLTPSKTPGLPVPPLTSIHKTP